jgi:hypothetical protein
MDQAETLANIQCPTVYIKALVKYGKDGVLYAQTRMKTRSA